MEMIVLLSSDSEVNTKSTIPSNGLGKPDGDAITLLTFDWLIPFW